MNLNDCPCQTIPSLAIFDSVDSQGGGDKDMDGAGDGCGEEGKEDSFGMIILTLISLSSFTPSLPVKVFL